jgi:hypothetical protein
MEKKRREEELVIRNTEYVKHRILQICEKADDIASASDKTMDMDYMKKHKLELGEVNPLYSTRHSRNIPRVLNIENTTMKGSIDMYYAISLYKQIVETEQQKMKDEIDALKDEIDVNDDIIDDMEQDTDEAIHKTKHQSYVLNTLVNLVLIFGALTSYLVVQMLIVMPLFRVNVLQYMICVVTTEMTKAMFSFNFQTAILNLLKDDYVLFHMILLGSFIGFRSTLVRKIHSWMKIEVC